MNSQFETEDIEAEFNRYFDKLSSASSVMVIGGGVTGIECAAEIALRFPNKKVTIACHCHFV